MKTLNRILKKLLIWSLIVGAGILFGSYAFNAQFVFGADDVSTVTYGNESYEEWISFSAMNSITNSASVALRRNYSTFGVECTRTGTTDIIFEVQSSKTNSGGFANMVGGSGHTMDSGDSDTYQFNIVNEKAKWLRLHGISGLDVTNALTCTIVAGGNN